MEAFLYMISRNILTYTLFRGTRAALRSGLNVANESFEMETIWNCPRCLQTWQGEGDELGENFCPFCDTLLKQVTNIPTYEERKYDRIQHRDSGDTSRTIASRS